MSPRDYNRNPNEPRRDRNTDVVRNSQRPDDDNPFDKRNYDRNESYDRERGRFSTDGGSWPDQERSNPSQQSMWNTDSDISGQSRNAPYSDRNNGQQDQREVHDYYQQLYRDYQQDPVLNGRTGNQRMTGRQTAIRDTGREERGFNSDPNYRGEYFNEANRRNYAQGYNYHRADTNGNTTSNTASDHRGKGPRNYRRSDDRILEDVNDGLTEHAGLDASEIEVAVKDAVVTLTGRVDSKITKRLAEDIADAVPGVREVLNNVRISS